MHYLHVRGLKKTLSTPQLLRYLACWHGLEACLQELDLVPSRSSGLLVDTSGYPVKTRCQSATCMLGFGTRSTSMFHGFGRIAAWLASGVCGVVPPSRKRSISSVTRWLLPEPPRASSPLEQRARSSPGADGIEWLQQELGTLQRLPGPRGAARGVAWRRRRHEAPRGTAGRRLEKAGRGGGLFGAAPRG